MSSLFRTSIILAVLVLLPATTHAVTITEWNFRGSNVPGRWEVRDLAPVRTDTGLHITAPHEGSLTRLTDLHHRIDDIIVHAFATQATEVFLLWHHRNMPPSNLVQLPFKIPSSTTPLSIELNVSSFPEWDPNTDRIGFAFPQGTDAILESMEFVGLQWWEHGIVAMQSFWTFDWYKPHSINFVWGPLLTFTPLSKKHMFYQLPPLAYSANIIFYTLMIIGAGAAIFYWHAHGRTFKARQKSATGFLMLIAILWIGYDIRMGAEWLSYVREDLRTYLLAEESTRTFRERGRFYDFATIASTYLTKDPTYIFLATHRWPYLGAMRYFTYPSIPTEPDQAQFGIDTWVVFDRPDISVDPSEHLVSEGTVVTPPGKVLYQFDDHSFIFRTR
ncbi:hypothetical protein HYZ98_01570 [Candidatus Peregrinibacteria bacterium]|nr:hypothetical protein [Candidatus Peregrinibacteria bacterium]